MDSALLLAVSAGVAVSAARALLGLAFAALVKARR
jgi:hypothetical protein